MKLIRFILTGTTLGLMLCSTQVNAQSLMLGLKAGVNMNRTGGDNLDGKFSGSFLGGAFGGVKFTAVKVQAELLFSQGKVVTDESFKAAFGQYLKSTATGIKEGTFKMNELSIPILVGYQLLPKLLWIEAGPQFTGVVSIKDVDGLVNESKDVFKTGYISGVVGASLDLPFHLNAGARYVFGLSNRNNTDRPDSWKTSHFQIHVGYSFL